MKQYVRELQDKQAVQSYFLVRDKAILSGKNGKAYMGAVLVDKTGEVDARIWDNVELLNEQFQSGDVVKIKGLAQVFQGRLQVIIHKLEKALPDEFTMEDLLSESKRPPEEMLQQLLQLVEKMENHHLRQLTLDTLNDPDIRPRVLLSPAAKTIHHAYKGGLLEHILSICDIMMFLASHYPQLKRDFLIFGAIFHDLGKIWELELDRGISYTDKGQLLGHMVMAVELIEKKASRILGFPEELKDLCKHIVLSHHGKIEYGSPKLPMFLEAYLVAAIDDLDSKINTISNFIDSERNTGERWSRFHSLFERYFYLRV